MRFPYFLSYSTLTCWKPLELPQDLTFAGKTVVITGANTGIGLEAARHFADRKVGRLILAVRSIERGEKAKEDIVKTTPCKTIEVWELDMDSFASVKEFSTKLSALDQLDILILNAGVATTTWQMSSEGWEKTLQVNVLSTALLGLLNLPKLVETSKLDAASKPHLVIVGSDAYEYGPKRDLIPHNALQKLNTQENFEGRSDRVERYLVSKTYSLFIARSLANAASLLFMDNRGDEGQPPVIVNCVNPGFCYSELLREGPPKIFYALQFLLARPAAKGSKTLVDAAAKGVTSHGKYLQNNKIWPIYAELDSADGIAIQDKCWNEILDILSQVAPEVERYKLSK